jgi:hypothetical protein
MAARQGHPCRKTVYRDADDRNRDDGQTAHGRRHAQTLGRLEPDERNQQPQEQSVEQCSEDFGAQIPVGLGSTCGPRRDPQGQQGERERGDIRKHVHRVGQQCEAVGMQSADYLGCEVDRGDCEYKAEPPPVPQKLSMRMVELHDTAREISAAPLQARSV